MTGVIGGAIASHEDHSARRCLTRQPPNRPGRMALLGGLLAIGILIAGCQGVSRPGSDPRGVPEPTEQRMLVHNGKERSYLIYKPKGAPGVRLPVVLLLHPIMSSADKFWRATSFSKIARDHGVILVAPDSYYKSIGKAWALRGDSDNVDDVGFVGKLIDEVIARDGGDPTRVYATGMSNGGELSYALACRIGNRLAAIAAVVVTMPTSLAGDCPSKVPMPVMLIAGTDDPIIAYGGGHPSGDKSIEPFLSVAETIAFWVRRNGCGVAPQERETVPSHNPADSTSVEKLTFGSCRGGGDVVQYIVTGGGHTWPGGEDTFVRRVLTGRTSQQIDASQRIWSFFQQQPPRWAGK